MDITHLKPIILQIFEDLESRPTITIYGRRAAITLRTARELTCDLCRTLDNRANVAIQELADEGKLIIDRGWVRRA